MRFKQNEEGGATCTDGRWHRDLGHNVEEDQKQLVTLNMYKISHDMVDAKIELECFKGRKNSPSLLLTHRI